MSKEEEALRGIEKSKKEREKAYTTLKGMIKGIRLRKLNPIEDAFLGALELMFDGFKNIWDDMVVAFELEIGTIQRVKSLEAKIEELETNILQLRETIDKLFHAR